MFLIVIQAAAIVDVINLGMTWDDAKRRCPDGVVPACHNSYDTVTISGSAAS